MDSIEQGVLERIRRAVEMTALCAEVAYWWQQPEDRRWSARLWAGGDWVIGVGPDAWTAVQAAHALGAAERNRLGY